MAPKVYITGSPVIYEIEGRPVPGLEEAKLHIGRKYFPSGHGSVVHQSYPTDMMDVNRYVKNGNSLGLKNIEDLDCPASDKVPLATRVLLFDGDEIPSSFGIESCVKPMAIFSVAELLESGL